eukprot:TRINITY_DN20416_c0_g1_i2.p1 TRINITY_DN20416_c0_g1~~TRINITY_DN20416_c0_g1_i2.p1  ORF type:complete len:107 (-),score=11.69 TRINITY_DN20416_c0_g1_i2:60-380(-)
MGFVIAALPCFQELAFDSINSEQVCQRPNAIKLSGGLKKLQFTGFSGQLMLVICKGLGDFGSLTRIDISWTRGVGNALCGILSQYIESSRSHSVGMRWVMMAAYHY